MTAMAKDRRQQPIKIEWIGLIGRLLVDGESWGAVEWSEKRQAWCIEDAEGRCLSHHAHVHGEHKDKAGAVALAEAMIRDGRMPTPEQATEARKERLKLDRERRAKQPSEIKRRQAKAERDRLQRASWDADQEERDAEESEPLYELVVDTFDLADPELWKSNSFARLRERLIVNVRAAIAELESNEERLRRWWREDGIDFDARLNRAREILKILTEGRHLTTARA
jgi:hypothetical protein